MVRKNLLKTMGKGENAGNFNGFYSFLKHLLNHFRHISLNFVLLEMLKIEKSLRIYCLLKS